jgi:hypothetical protein
MYNLYKQLNQTVYWLCHRLHNINLWSMYGNEASFFVLPWSKLLLKCGRRGQASVSREIIYIWIITSYFIWKYNILDSVYKIICKGGVPMTKLAQKRSHLISCLPTDLCKFKQFLIYLAQSVQRPAISWMISIKLPAEKGFFFMLWHPRPTLGHIQSTV